MLRSLNQCPCGTVYVHRGTDPVTLRIPDLCNACRRARAAEHAPAPDGPVAAEDRPNGA